MENSPLITTDELASWLNIDIAAVQHMLATGKLPGISIGDRWYMRRDMFETWLQQQVITPVDELEIIYHTAPIGLAVVDTQLRFLRVNQRLAEINGVSAQEHIGRTIREVVPNLADQIEPLYHRIFDTGIPILNAETHGETPAMPGVIRTWLGSIVPIRSANGTINAVSVVMQEVTERKLAEQREKKARLDAEYAAERIMRLQIVTAALGEAITVHQVGQIVVEQSMAVLDAHFGGFQMLSDDGEWFEMVYSKSQRLSDEELRQWQRFPAHPGFPITDAVRRKQIIVLATADEAVSRYPALTAYRRNYHGAFVVIPIIIGEECVGAITLGFNITHRFIPGEIAFMGTLAQQCAQTLERAWLYEAEANARRAAEKADQLKLQFLAMISHELRTPLTSIKGFISTLLATDVHWDAENQRQFLSIANDEADKLTELVEELLDLSRLQAGSLSISLEPQLFDLIVQASRNELEILAANHLLTINIAPGLPYVMADAGRITQVLTNLVGNAAKYSPAMSPITLSAYLEDDMLRVDVRDQGEGIPSEYRSMVFEAFRQADRKGLAKKQGAGLGLAICKGLIEAHGGRIWIEDQPLPGTTMSFTLCVVK